MNHPVVTALLPVILLIAIGWLAGRRRWIGPASVKDLSGLVFMVLAPALLFRTMAGVREAALDWRPLVTYFVVALSVYASVLSVCGFNRRGAVLAGGEATELPAGSSIVNICSVAAVAGHAAAAYTSSKWALRGLAKAACLELGPRGVRVNTVVPGWVMTERQLKLWVTPEAEADIDRNQCLPGRIVPVDIAAMVLFLASDDARMCTGQEFTVDAGWS